MNLVGDPWIPVALPDGRSELVSLRDAFNRGDQIRDLAATPPQRIALTRLLVCVAQAALDGPSDEKDWSGCLERIAPSALDYLERHYDGFELYARGEEGAFLQVPNLAPKENAVVDKLDFGLAAGNNATLFDHEAGAEGRNLSPELRALGLLTFQCFSPGGTIGTTRWNGTWTTSDGRKPKGPGTSEHAPCLDGGPLHTILRDRNLLGTIHSNLLTRETVDELPSLVWGRPVWEAMPTGPADSRAHEIARSYLGRLVPLARAVRLSPSSTRMTMCNGLSYPKFPEVREPSTIVVQKKDGTPVYLSIDLERHPWRELSSLLAYSPTRMEGRALVLSHLRPAEEGIVDIWTGGLASDKGKVLDLADWSFALPLDFLGDMSLQSYQRGVDLANTATMSLWSAVSIYCDDLKLSEKKTKHKKNVKARGLYWSQLDQRYHVLIRGAAEVSTDRARNWYQEVRRAMDIAFDQSCPHTTARQLRAYAKGKQALRLKLPKE